MPKPKEDLEEKDNEEEIIALDNIFSVKDSKNIEEIVTETPQESDLKESILEKIN